ncbi:MAG: prevent-host-death protein [Actinomycetes bacterium]
MSQTISQRELRNDSARILRELAAGQEFLLTRAGVVVARLEPVAGASLVPIEQLRASRGSKAAVDLGSLRSDLDVAVDPHA